MSGIPGAAGNTAVKVREDAAKGWYEISNGLTGVRLPTGKIFTDETAGLDAATLASAASSDWGLSQVKQQHKLVPVNPAPVQGVQLRDGRWTAQGPNLLDAGALCCGMKVEFLAARAAGNRGPVELPVQRQAGNRAQPAVSRTMSRLSRRRRPLHLHDHGDGGSADDPVRGGRGSGAPLAVEPLARIALSTPCATPPVVLTRSNPPTWRRRRRPSAR